MSEWWYILIVGVLVVLIVLTLRSRRQRPRQRETDAATARDHSAEREGARRTHMSDADRAWEDASLQRQRDGHTPEEPPDRS